MGVVSPRQAEPPLVLALDLGSSSVRAMVYDRTAREVDGTEGRSPVLWRSLPGGVEADPDAVLDAVWRAIDQAMAGAGKAAAAIRAVGTSTFWHNILGLGPEGRPVTPLYSWADRRSAGAACALRERLDEEAARRRTGCVFHPSYPMARLYWIRQAAPDVYRSVRRWVSIGEYLTLRCFGRPVCSISMASGTGLLDQYRCDWDGEMLETLGLTPDRLAPLADLDAPLVGLAPEFAARWPALAKVPWLPPAGDGALSNIGAGCVTPSRAALVIGTSGALRVLWRGPVRDVPRGLWVYRLDRARVLTGGAVSNGGNVYRWVRERAALGPPDEVEEALRRRPPAAHGLVVLPFLAGERSPWWPPAARGAVVGMTLATAPLDLLQACLEAVAYRIGLIWELLRGAVPEVGEIIASGGALHGSPAWTQIIADALGHEVIASGEYEGSSRGAALAALEVLGAVRADEVSAPMGAVFAPDPDRHAAHRDAAARQRRVEEALRPLQDLIAH